MKRHREEQFVMTFQCNQDFAAMPVNTYGRYCEQCAKSILDLTGYNKESLERKIKKEKDGFCARINSKQLQEINDSIDCQEKPVRELLNVSLLIASLAFSSCSSHKDLSYPNRNCYLKESEVEILEDNCTKQYSEKIIGVIVDENGLPLIGTNIYVSDSIFAISDIDGRFEMPINKSYKNSISMIISYTGYKTLTVPVDTLINKEVKVTLAESGELLGEIIYVPPPWYKRAWNSIVGIFR